MHSEGYARDGFVMKLALVLACLALAVLLASCGGGEGAQKDEASDPEPAATETTAEAEQAAEPEAAVEPEPAAEPDAEKAAEEASQEDVDSIGDATYESILADYTAQLEEATPTLIEEFNAEAEGVTDVVELANICTDKIQELALIETQGTERMALVMYRDGDDYEVYEDWSMKLYDVYEAQSMEITSAYEDAALNAYL